MIAITTSNSISVNPWVRKVRLAATIGLFGVSVKKPVTTSVCLIVIILQVYGSGNIFTALICVRGVSAQSRQIKATCDALRRLHGTADQFTSPWASRISEDSRSKMATLNRILNFFANRPLAVLKASRDSLTYNSCLNERIRNADQLRLPLIR